MGHVQVYNIIIVQSTKFEFARQKIKTVRVLKYRLVGIIFDKTQYTFMILYNNCVDFGRFNERTNKRTNRASINLSEYLGR